MLYMFGAALVVCISAVAVGGCGAVDCTTVDIPALLVEVETAEGASVLGEENLVVEWRKASGSEDLWENCRSVNYDPVDGCYSIKCGPDAGGTYDVRVTQGELSGQKLGIKVGMDSDGCHVIQREVTVTIE